MKILALNHKMNLSKDEVLNYIDKVSKINYTDVELIICPSLPYLNLFQGSKFKLGSQNVAMIDNGALTGEVSASQLKSLGVNYSLVGHSERRNILNETDEMINRKIIQLINNDIVPILCVGETKDERLNNMTQNTIKEEIINDFKGLDNLESIIIAYEPIWAIGTGLVPSNEEISEVIKFIKEFIIDNYGVKLKVLYGGSVSDSNISNLEEISEIDGYLVGGASLKADLVNTMIENIRR